MLTWSVSSCSRDGSGAKGRSRRTRIVVAFVARHPIGSKKMAIRQTAVLLAPLYALRGAHCHCRATQNEGSIQKATQAGCTE